MRPTVLVLAIAIAGCGGAFRPFAPRPIVWSDDDVQPFAGPPSELYNPWAWDAIDHTIFRQASHALEYERSREAIDVNALDEVPSSSWYTNRISIAPMTDEELVRGACDRPMPGPPYRIVQGKMDGTSPGAVIETVDGQRYLMKIDFGGQPEHGTAADAIATRLLYAAGYTVPCNVVGTVRAGELSIAPDARRARGTDDPFTQADLDAILGAAVATADGARRVSFSRWMDGRPLGGFRFEGVRGDDPNDVVPHQHRRELRALYVLAAWMGHIDTRAENNLDLWIETSPGRGYVRHAILDAGDSFGMVWRDDVDFAMARRFGNAHYLDLEQILGDIATLGIAERAYRDAERGPAWEVFGYYDVERFDPDDWRNGYPNPAFERRTEADCAWMARIVARIGAPEIHAVVSTGRFGRALYARELERILLGRRARILERYLLRLSPLAEPAIDGAALCMRDLAVESRMRVASERTYSAGRRGGIPPEPVDEARVRASGARVCVDLLPSPRGGYQVIDLRAGTRGRERSHPARVHVVTDGAGHTIVGLERPGSDDPP